MITKELVNQVLEKHKNIRTSVSCIHKKYKVRDFIFLSKVASDYYMEGHTEGISINGCLLDNRDNNLITENDKVRGRLQMEYLEFLDELMKNDCEDDIVFYIIAYHYLMVCKETAYNLSISAAAPFPNEGYELSQIAIDQIKKYRDVIHDIGYSGFDIFTEEDLLFYNSIFFELNCHSSVTKHYSILCSYLGMKPSVSRYRFDDSFIQMIELFIFRYRAVFTDKKLKQFIYEDIDEKEIINGLMAARKE